MKLWFLKSDAELVREAMADRPRAFEELVHRYLNKAYAIARSLGVNAGALDDVVQESLLKALREMGSLRNPASFGPWFLNILRNASREEVRRQGRGASSASLDAREGKSADRAEEQDFQEYLWRKVMELPEGIREAVFLYYHDGESTRRVAKTLGISRSAVKNRLLKGRDVLRERLWREMEKCFHDLLPSARGWKRRGRYLSLLAMLSMAPASALQAQQAPALVPGTAAVLLVLVLGAMVLAPLPFAVRRSSEPAAAGGPSRPARAAVAAREAARGLHRREAIQVLKERTGVAGAVFLEREGGDPAADACVAAIRDGERGQCAVARTGADGKYELAVAPGLYRLWAWRGSWTPQEPQPGALQVQKDAVTGEVNWVLVPGVTVAVQVVEEGTESPIPHATVGFNRVQFALTNLEGRCLLEGIPARQVALSASAAGFATRLAQADLAEGDEPLVRFELPPGGIIEGRISTATGPPAAGAAVEAIVPSGPASNTSIRVQALADAQGRYRLEGLPVVLRNFRVSAAMDGLFAASLEVAGFPEEGSRLELDLVLSEGVQLAGRVLDHKGQPLGQVRLFIDRATAKPVAASDDEGHFRIAGVSEAMEMLTARKSGHAPATCFLRDLSPSERERLELVLEPGHTISGTVVDAAGKPLAGAWVYVSTADPHAGPYPSVYTDRDGRFSFGELSARLKEIGALKTGYLDNRGNPVEADRSGLRLVMAEAGRIQGLVVDRATGSPLRAFSVLTAEAGRGPGPPLRFGSGEGPFAGRFTVTQLTPGVRYDIAVQADGCLEARVEGVEAWRPGESREPLRIEVEEGGTLRGQVVTLERRRPLADARVEHRSPGSRGAVRTTTTDGEGRFVLRGLPAVPGTLLVERPGYARAAGVPVQPSLELQVFTMQPEAVLEGTVLTDLGQPLAGASVRIDLGERESARAMTGASGRYRVEGLPSGSALVQVERPGRLTMAGEAQLEAGTATVLDFMEAPGSIAGRVTSRGKPAAGAELHLSPQGESAKGAWTSSDLDGAFRFGAVPPGSFRIQVKRPGEEGGAFAAERTVEVAAGEARVDVLLPEGSLEGQALDHLSGRPVGGIAVLLYQQPAVPPREDLLRSDLDDWVLIASRELSPGESRFGFQTLPGGRYFLAAISGGARAFSGWLGPLELPAGGAAAGLTMALGGTEALAATVLDAATRAPVENAWVALRQDGLPGSAAAQSTDPSGRALLHGLPRGDYRLEAAAGGRLPVVEPVRLSGDVMERTVLLEPASWVVVDLSDGTAGAAPRRVVAVALSGGDPGWRRRTIEDGRPAEVGLTGAGEGTRVRFMTRPGKYRLRFHAAGDIVQELEVTVPKAGEAMVELGVRGGPEE